MQELFDKEKQLRAKGIADKQTAEMVMHLQTENIQTLWDVQQAYDADFLGLKDRCAFGARGLCCRNCAMGPCRLATEDFPMYLRTITPAVNRSTCGKGPSEMISGMLLSDMIRGVSAHLGQAIYVVKAFLRAPSIRDEEKLKKLCLKLGIKKKNISEAARELGNLAMEDLLGQGQGPMRFALALLPKNSEKLLESGLIPSAGAAELIVEATHATSHGTLSNVDEIINYCFRLAFVDMAALFIASEFQDIMLGAPSPVASRIGFDVLKEDKINIVVHGHLPMLPEKILEQAKKNQKINLVGLCCTGNEVLMRHGIPLVGSNLQQELALGTGLVDAITVDFQCIFPSLSEIAKKFHTKLITTFREGRMEGDTFVPFREDKADQAASTIIKLAEEAFAKRQKSKIFLPGGHAQTLMAGFTAENLLFLLGKINPKDPLKPLVDFIKKGDIQGVVLLAGCTSPKIQSDMSYVAVARALIKENILVLTTGCAAQSLARHGLLASQAALQAGDSLRVILAELGRLAGLETALPPILHFGSCVDNSRVITLVNALSDYLNVPVSQLPLAVSSTEPVAEKATAIGIGAGVFGLTVHIGVAPKLSFATPFPQTYIEKLQKLNGGNFMAIIDPEEAGQALVNIIKEKRKNLGI